MYRLDVPPHLRPRTLRGFLAAAHAAGRTFGPRAWRLPLVTVLAAASLGGAAIHAVVSGDVAAAYVEALLVFALGPAVIYVAVLVAFARAARRGSLWVFRDETGIAVVDVQPGREGVRAGLFAARPARHGLGSRLGREVLAAADAAACPIMLNCRPQLASSYEQAGFAPTAGHRRILVTMRRDPRRAQV